MDLKTVCAKICAPPSRAEARREKVIETARTLFAENGFHNTGIAQIAKHSGVFVGQIYRDFSNKEDIVAAIVARDLEIFLDDNPLRQAALAGDAIAVREWIAEFVASDTKDDDQCKVIADILAESTRNERIATIVGTLQDRMQETIADALAVLAPDAEQEPRRLLLTEVILTISAGVFHRRLMQAGAIDPTVITALRYMINREIDALIAPTEYAAPVLEHCIHS